MEVRVGQVVTLAQLFYLGAEFCSAYDMYRLYMDLPIFVHKQRRESHKVWGPANRKYIRQDVPSIGKE